MCSQFVDKYFQCLTNFKIKSDFRDIFHSLAVRDDPYARHLYAMAYTEFSLTIKYKIKHIASLNRTKNLSSRCVFGLTEKRETFFCVCLFKCYRTERLIYVQMYVRMRDAFPIIFVFFFFKK